MLILILSLYLIFFIGFSVYDLLYLDGYQKYIALCIDIFFGFIIISSSIESYIKKEISKKK